MLKMIYVNLLSCVVGEIGFPDRSVGEESAYNAGDPSSIPRSGRYLGEGNGKPLQYSCLENPMNCTKRQKDRTLKDVVFLVYIISYSLSDCS